MAKQKKRPEAKPPLLPTMAMISTMKAICRCPPWKRR
jgi:hypothetical protein